MKMNRIISEDMLTHVDITNTLAGGVVEPQVTLTQFPEYGQVTLHIPSVQEDRFKIEITNNQLTILYFLDIDSMGKKLSVPQVAYSKPIPYFIDVNNISASFEDQSLIVKLPFNECADGYYRNIEIAG
jgi:HSP20 family molecular chaperone IbpA